MSTIPLTVLKSRSFFKGWKSVIVRGLKRDDEDCGNILRSFGGLGANAGLLNGCWCS